MSTICTSSQPIRFGGLIIEFVKEFAPLFIAGIVLLFVIAVCVIASGYRKSVRASVRRLHERDQMLSGMAEDYDAIFVADLNSRKVSTIRYTEDSRKVYGKKSKITHISDIVDRLRINVHPDDIAALEKALAAAVAEFNKAYPGVSFKATAEGWTMDVPQKYEIGHEAHFSQVMNMYLGWMKKGEQPADYLPNMLVKYYTLAEAWKASR